MTVEQIKNINFNKEQFRTLLEHIPNTEKLFEELSNEGFFAAPATVKYSSSFPGGLCYHSLQVYSTMLVLNIHFNFGVDPTSILKVGLLHEIGKINYYEETVINKKVYDENGEKIDEVGRFRWQSVRGYKVKEDVVHTGSIGLKSYLLASKFISFTPEETAALINYNSLTDKTSPDSQSLLADSKLLTLLHTAIIISRYIKEKENA